ERAREAEAAGAFDEKRASLLESRLERGEVDDGRIHLDLSEVRVHRRDEREVRRDRVTRVESAARIPLAVAAEGIALRVDEVNAGQCVRDQFETTSLMETIEAGEIAERADAARLRLAREGELREFLAPIDDPLDLQPPRVDAADEAKLAERDAE